MYYDLRLKYERKNQEKNMFCWDQINWDILELPVIPQSRKINADTV